MKNYLVSLLVVCSAGALLTSCEKDNKGKLDSNAKISITGTASPTKTPAVNPDGIAGTDLTDSLEFITKYAVEFSTNKMLGTALGFDDEYYYMFRNLEHNKFWYWGTNVISERGELSYFVMTYEDFVFTVLSDGSGNAIMPLNYTGSLGVPRDTVAYIPNAVVREARTKIAAAFAAENYAECYRLFDEAYIFVPTTGAKWRALKAAGIE